MNDKLKYDHFKNTKELLEHIAVWYRDDDVYFSRWFGLNDLNNLRIYINQLQSNWNSLREFVTLKEKPKVFGAKNGKTLELAMEFVFDMVLDKINELEKRNENEK